MMSEIVWEKYRSGTGITEPFVVHFPDYSKGNLKIPKIGISNKVAVIIEKFEHKSYIVEYKIESRGK